MEQIFDNCRMDSSIFLQFLKPSKEFFARIFLHYEEKLSEFIHFDTYFPKKKGFYLEIVLSSCDLFRKVKNCGSPIKPEPPASLEPDCKSVKNCPNISMLAGSFISFNLRSIESWSLFMNSRISLICFRIRSST